jgi:DDE superfamily endonuclease
MITNKAVMDSLPEDAGAGPAAVLSRFRRDFHSCLTARADELCELADAVLCAGGPVRSLAGLSLAAEHRRGHGALYGAVNHGRIDVARLRRSLAGLPLPRAADGRLMLAVDVSSWLRPGAPASPGRRFCHVYGRGKGQAQMIPGWPYSVVAALEPGRTSWTAVLDAVRLGPDDDEMAVTAAQVRDVVTRLIGAGHWRGGDPAVLVIFDAGYDIPRLSFLLADLPAEMPGRLRSDRVMQLPAPPRQPDAVGRPRKHGGELALADPPASRPPARRPPSQAPLAMVLGHQHRPRSGGPAVAGVLAPFRPRAHLPAVQAGPRLDRAQDPRPRRRPVDLADHHGPRPAPPGPAAR